MSTSAKDDRFSKVFTVGQITGRLDNDNLLRDIKLPENSLSTRNSCILLHTPDKYKKATAIAYMTYVAVSPLPDKFILNSSIRSTWSPRTSQSLPFTMSP